MEKLKREKKTYSEMGYIAVMLHLSKKSKYGMMQKGKVIDIVNKELDYLANYIYEDNYSKDQFKVITENGSFNKTAVWVNKDNWGKLISKTEGTELTANKIMVVHLDKKY